MTLDLILFRPEFFFLFSFFVLLWYGTGNLVTPVAEILTVSTSPAQQRQRSTTAQGHRHARVSGLATIAGLSSGSEGLWQAKAQPEANKQYSTNQTRGPNHAVSALTLWAVVWCFLSFQLAVYSPQHLVFLGGSFQKDAYSQGLSRILFFTGCFVQRVSYGWQKAARICHTEYIYLAMQALMGQYQQIMATDQMSLYLSMEQQSFSLVVLCGQNSKSAYSLEAAMKYFQQSAFRSCQLLLGVGFIYWQTGETSLPHIEKIVQRTRNNPSQLTALGIWLISTGLLWKQAAAPLHFWVPDVYMGAWSSVSQWITIMPKIAVLGFWTHHWQAIWNMSFRGTLTMFRAFSMIVGRIAPLAQTNLKRLLAYSSVGHIGLLLIPLCGNNLSRNGSGDAAAGTVITAIPGDSIGVLWAYMLIYAIINVGVWSQQLWPMYRPVSVFGLDTSHGSTGEASNRESVNTSDGSDKGLAEQANSSSAQRGGLHRRGSTMPLAQSSAPQFLWDLKGLNTSSARAAFRWAVFMTCQAGLPPAYSFQGKAAIIWNAVNNGLFILVGVAQAYTMIGSVYYLKVMKIAYVDNPETWRSYAKVSPITAYIIAISVAVMLIGQWHGNSLFQFTHLQGLSVSLRKHKKFTFLKLFINDFWFLLVCLCYFVLHGRYRYLP